MEQKLLGLLIALATVVWIASAKEEVYVYLKSAKCNFSSEFYHRKAFCYAKSLNRTCSTVSAYFETIHPFNYAMVSCNHWSMQQYCSSFFENRFKEPFTSSTEPFTAKSYEFRPLNYAPPWGWALPTNSLSTSFIFSTRLRQDFSMNVHTNQSTSRRRHSKFQIPGLCSQAVTTKRILFNMIKTVSLCSKWILL